MAIPWVLWQTLFCLLICNQTKEECMEYYVTINHSWLIRGDTFIFLFFILYSPHSCYLKFFIWNHCMWINFQGKMFLTEQNFCNNAAFYSHREYLTLHFITTVPALCFKTFFDKYISIRKKLLWVETIFHVCKSWPRRGSNTWTDSIWMIIVLLVNCWKVS